MKPTKTAAVLCGAALMAGCSAGDGADTGPAEPVPVVVATTSPDVWPELPDGVLATGTFEGAATGEVEIRNSGDGMMTLHISGFSIGIERHYGLTALSYPSYPSEECGSRPFVWSFGFEEEGVVPETYEAVVPLDGFAGDPSVVREIIIRDMDAPEWSDECAAAPAAKAVLDWTYEPLRASLVAVDQGASGGARGTAIEVDDEVVQYVVAPNDLIGEVAARFGMTADDIGYLNPLLGQKLRVDETLILNGAFR